MDKSVEQLRAELKRAEEAEKQKQEERAKACPPIWRFTITPDNSKFDRIYDDTCRLYRLSGVITNKEETEAAGNHIFSGSEGGMSYVFNSLSGKIVMGVGGGRIFVSGRTWNPNPDEDNSAVETFEKISAFIRENPEGGDITDIVNEHREAQHGSEVHAGRADPQGGTCSSKGSRWQGHVGPPYEPG